MSRRLISRSPDLRRLSEEGYDLQVTNGSHLLIKDVPYVTSTREVRRGVLVSVLDQDGDMTAKPGTHVAMFAGEPPCHQDGRLLSQIIINSDRKVLEQGLEIQHTFSSKPVSGAYKDYYEKMATYVAILSSPAQAIDANATAKTSPVIVEAEEDSVFNYVDTASTRAGIAAINRKLAGNVAIIGLGGTGSYVLDLVAKTPVKEVHLFDGDDFKHHNAFRAPGAPSVEQLRAPQKKVAYFRGIYSKMHRHIVPHEYFVDAANADELRGMDFVFVCIDKGAPKRAIVEKLEELGTSFIDVGMGVYVRNDSLFGILRVTASTSAARAHVREKDRIPFSGGDEEDEYRSNIQVADLNALNATLAVVKWKKFCGFYGDFEREHFSAYTIDGNALINEDQPA